MLHHLQNNDELQKSFPLAWIFVGLFCIAVNFVDLKTVNLELLTPWLHILQIIFVFTSIMAIGKKLLAPIFDSNKK